MIKRRAFCLGWAAVVLPTSSAWAAPALEEKRLRNRLELWENYAGRTTNLIAQVTTTRESSLLVDPLVVTGTLVFRAPDLLVLRDDGLDGSTTRIAGDALQILPNAPERPSGPPIKPNEHPAAAWLADRLVRLFAPGKGAGVIEGARTHVPRGPGYRLEVLPPRGSTVRRLLRSISVHLDPVAGAITRITVAEAQGDRLHLRFSDHRQNLPGSDIDAALQPVEALVQKRNSR